MRNSLKQKTGTLNCFVFSYYGVGNLMKKLESRKINEKKLKLPTRSMMKTGNEKKLTQKVNRYEVHEIENRKLGVFIWGAEQNILMQ